MLSLLKYDGSRTKAVADGPPLVVKESNYKILSTMGRFLAALWLAASCVTAQSIFNLSDVSWTVSNGVNATVPGKLPSYAHIDLLAAGVIDDPIYGFNEWNQFWVQRMNWTYTSGPIKGL